MFEFLSIAPVKYSLMAIFFAISAVCALIYFLRLEFLEGDSEPRENSGNPEKNTVQTQKKPQKSAMRQKSAENLSNFNCALSAGSDFTGVAAQSDGTALFNLSEPAPQSKTEAEPAPQSKTEAASAPQEKLKLKLEQPQSKIEPELKVEPTHSTKSPQRKVETVVAANKIVAKVTDKKTETKASVKKEETKTAAKKRKTKTAAKKPETKTAAKKTEIKIPAKKADIKTAAKKPETKTPAKNAEAKASVKKPGTKTAAKKTESNSQTKKTTAKPQPPKPAVRLTEEEKQAKLLGKYQIKEVAYEDYQFELYDNKNKLLFQSVSYSSQAACEKYIGFFKNHVKTGTFEVKGASGAFFFTLARGLASYAGTPQKTKAAAENQAEAVKQFSQSAIIVIKK